MHLKGSLITTKEEPNKVQKTAKVQQIVEYIGQTISKAQTVKEREENGSVNPPHKNDQHDGLQSSPAYTA